MKLMHLSDLHLGKRLYEYSLLDDQRHILNQILDLADREGPRAIVIAGDIYDKSTPPAEAVALVDEFLCRLAQPGRDLFVISGNHDSAERIAFGGRLMGGSGVHVSPVYLTAVQPVTLDGRFDFYMLPFLKPAVARERHPDREIANYTDAVRAAIDEMPMREGHVRILIAHQFVTGAVTSDSEEISVGDAGNVDANVFAPFHYVALGHIHKSQNISSLRVRYCGTPLAYSVGEGRRERTVTIAELDESGELEIRELPLLPLRRMRALRGTFSEVFALPDAPRGDYVEITLTDEEDVPEAFARLRAVYPYMLRLNYDNARTRAQSRIEEAADIEEKTPLQLFEELFEMQNGRPMTDSQRAIITRMIEQIKEERA